ncbi:VOC family protein [Bacillus sp. RAR_GA_16]|uniref:VOC family protein n=1 Tax=Bacillus sp. RAR_GA_16 TaxID=2876774 RepID=UPI001CCA37C3|nr:VOC family protein [Bacillus sp. RAR_GA_16]MCA0171913.1 VOC family protein [Bacillus sp. RAR_GA_16]
MINQIGQIMLYVDNQDEALAFWTEKVGFHHMAEENNSGGMRWIEIAPTLEGATSIVLHDKAFIAKMEPELNLGTPSLMFYTNDLDHLYESFKSKKITVGEIVSMPFGRVFNFADPEEHYFAVMEKNQA